MGLSRAMGRVWLSAQRGGRDPDAQQHSSNMEEFFLDGGE